MPVQHQAFDSRSNLTHPDCMHGEPEGERCLNKHVCAGFRK